MLPAATNGLALGSGLGTHCNRKRRLNAAVLRARLLLSPHSSHLDSAPGVSGSLWFSFTRCRAMYDVRGAITGGLAWIAHVIARRAETHGALAPVRLHEHGGVLF